MILFLCNQMWSMGENKGVSSLYRLIESVKQKKEIEVLMPGKPLFIIQNKYLAFFYNFLYYIFINVKYILIGLSLKRPNAIYVSSPLPSVAAKILSKYYKCPYMQRLYGGFLYSRIGKKYEMLKSYQEVFAYCLKAERYVITNDGTHGDKVAKYFNIQDDKVLFLINGVDRQDVSLREPRKMQLCNLLNLPADGFFVISVSRLVSLKRVDRIIEAVNKLVDYKDVYYLVLGDGEQMKYYKSIAKNSNILFLGAKNKSELFDYYMLADLFVSMYQRTNLVNPVLEAMSAGLPIITIDNGETKKVFNGKNMVLLEQKDDEELVDDLSKLILKLKFDYSLRERLKKYAKEYADNNLLSWEERIHIEENELFRLAEGDYNGTKVSDACGWS